MLWVLVTAARAGEVSCEALLRASEGADAAVALPRLIDAAEEHDYWTTAETVSCLEDRGAPDWLVWWAQENVVEAGYMVFSPSLGTGYQTGLVGVTFGLRWFEPERRRYVHRHAYLGLGWAQFEPTNGYAVIGVGVMTGFGHQHRFLTDVKVGVTGRYLEVESGRYPVALGSHAAVGYEFDRGPWEFSARLLGGLAWTWLGDSPTWMPVSQLAIGF